MQNGQVNIIALYTFIGIANSQLLLPDFLSNWTTITAGNDSTLSTHHVYHGLGETPLLVDVQVRAIDGPLSGFIFQASGHVIRDDDEPEGYGNVVYIYDDVQVIVSAPVTANNNLGRAIYTAQSPYWEGLYQQDSFSAEFRVRAWKASSLPTPNFYDTYILVSGSDSDSVSYVEFSHKLNLYPDLVICRIQFTSNTSEYSDFYADSTGAGNIMYNTSDEDNGYVIFGFNNNTIRVWAPSVPNGALFRGKDGSAFDVTINSATLEVYAWTFNGSYTITSLEQDISSTKNNDIFYNYHYYFDFVYYDLYYYYYYQYTYIWTDLTFTRAWAKAVDGANEGFMFPGGGSLSYDTDIHAQPCTYGGLVYAFVEYYYYTRIDIWRPGNATNGALICIQDLNGAGNNAQASRDGVLVMRTMLIQCGILKPVENGIVIYDGYYTYIAHLGCKSGYTHYGDLKAICTRRGWVYSQWNCSKNGCSDPTPEHGASNNTDNSNGSVVEIVCEEGYNIQGNTTIVCQTDGLWSDNTTCSVKDCGSPVPQNGAANSTNTTFGTVLKISCIPGYNLSGNAEIVCQANGSWSNYPTCEKINCGSPVPQYGAANSTNTTFGTVLKISCIPGYNLSGNAEIVCQANTFWSNKPTCEKINCGSPVPQYGTANSTNTTFGTVLKISCIPGYNLSGSSEIVCQANGSWSNNPTCEKINCGSPVPQHGTANDTISTYGTVLKITCDPGYSLSGNSEIVCQANGSWSNNPTCERRCQDLQCYNDGTCKDGQLTCNCTKGFEGNQCEIALFGKTCNAITKCKTQKAICKQSLCTCETGIYNEKLDICDSMPLYSYGSKDDTVLADIDDSCSVAIQYKQGVPVFDQLYTDIYICANGIVSFGAPFHNPTPTKHIFTHRDLNLLAPFYGDILISGGGRLFHRSFDIVNNASVLKSTEINNIENLIKTYGHIRSFETQFILIATWYKVKPWPETHNNSQEATFQMILITDGMETFALYIYGHDQMGWTSSGSDPNVYAGYIMGRNYYSHAYSFASPILKLDKYTETQGISGFTLKRLTSPNPESSGAKECLTWYRQNVNRKATIDLKAKQLPDCPCNFISLLFDPWFSFFGGAQSNGVYCTSAWSSPRTFPHGKTCCYNTSLWLWTDEKPIAGGFQFYHPSLYIKEHSIHDVNAKENCCQKSNLCNLYYDLHPVGTCYSRSWFWFGTFWGDPHFRTLDNFNFTFNGWGEYVLMNLKTNISDFELQARTERAIKDNGNFSDATVFSAFAVREDNMSLFHVGLNESTTGLLLYGNGIDLTRKFEESDDDKVTQILTSTPNSSLEILKINKTVRAVFTLTG